MVSVFSHVSEEKLFLFMNLPFESVKMWMCDFCLCSAGWGMRSAVDLCCVPLCSQGPGSSGGVPFLQL